MSLYGTIVATNFVYYKGAEAGVDYIYLALNFLRAFYNLEVDIVVANDKYRRILALLVGVTVEVLLQYAR